MTFTFSLFQAAPDGIAGFARRGSSGAHFNVTHQ